jgi:hypothetical protein
MKRDVIYLAAPTCIPRTDPDYQRAIRQCRILGTKLGLSYYADARKAWPDYEKWKQYFPQFSLRIGAYVFLKRARGDDTVGAGAAWEICMLRRQRGVKFFIAHRDYGIVGPFRFSVKKVPRRRRSLRNWGVLVKRRCGRNPINWKAKSGEGKEEVRHA